MTETISNPALRELALRGFIQQTSKLEALDQRMNEGPIRFYIGVDPTAPSLHIGHMLPIFAAARLAQAGHEAIVLIGTGTALIGDPSGKSEMRKILSRQTIEENAAKIQRQIEAFFTATQCPVRFVHNSEWLNELNYIEFLRDIGRHFSVNRMLGFEAYKQRLERGLSFIEFNYQLLQSYDFLELYRRENCQLQIGGDDQWGNIIAGVDLIRRVEGQAGAARIAALPAGTTSARSTSLQSTSASSSSSVDVNSHSTTEAYALTFPLITTANGKKMGKTEAGAIFLDPALTSAFEFYQYLRNTQDTDVPKLLRLFSFLPLQKIEALCESTEAAAINAAKEQLAYEVTSIFHGTDEAESIRSSLQSTYGSTAEHNDAQALRSTLPVSYRLSAEEEAHGIPVCDLLVRCGLCESKSAARRLIQQGGARLNGSKLLDFEHRVLAADFVDNEVLLQAGKKRYARACLS